ncbi:MAG: 5-hydroxyisourate hydrolase [Planctomycetota bacterium]|jgi:5-hydroxyisourate hydrolase
MGSLTTHVLDTARGCPAVGIKVSLYRVDLDREELVHGVTNSDGRLDHPLLQNEDFTCGKYELIFQAGDYFRAFDSELAEPLFVDEVIIRFGVGVPGQHYHVPLLVSPWAYSTYRGS